MFNSVKIIYSNFNYYILIITCLFYTGNCYSDNINLTLKNAVEQSLNKHPSISSARATYEAASAARDAAEWARFPKITANTQPNIYTEQSVNGNSSVSIDQPIWTGGRIDGQIKNNLALEKSAQIAELESQHSIVEQTTIAFVNVIRAEDRLNNIDKSIKKFQELVDYVERREKGGLASQSDILIAKNRLSSLLFQREQTRGDLQRTQAELQVLIVSRQGIEKYKSVDIPYIDTSEIKKIEDQFLDKSQVLSQKKMEIQAALAAVEVKKAGVLPTVSLRAEQIRYNNFGGSVSEDKRIGFTLQYTPDAGLASLSYIKEAQSKLQGLREQLRTAELDILLRFKTSYSDYLSAQLQIEELKPQLKSLDNSANSFVRQFESGRKTWIDVLNAYKELLDGHQNLSKAYLLREQSAIRIMSGTDELYIWIQSLQN